MSGRRRRGLGPQRRSRAEIDVRSNHVRSRRREAHALPERSPRPLQSWRRGLRAGVLLAGAGAALPLDGRLAAFLFDRLRRACAIVLEEPRALRRTGSALRTP